MILRKRKIGGLASINHSNTANMGMPNLTVEMTLPPAVLAMEVPTLKEVALDGHRDKVNRINNSNNHNSTCKEVTTGLEEV